MANHASAIKRAKESVRRALHNRTYIACAKRSIKDCTKAITLGKKDDVRGLLNTAKKTVLSTAAKGIIPKNTAARKISKLEKKVNAFLRAA